VGRVTIIDSQSVELSNLNRQLLHWQKDIDRPKTESAYEKLSRFNPSVTIETRQEEITRDNVIGLLGDADIVVDGMDNYPTRFLLNEACVKTGKPFIHGAVKGLAGQMTTIIPGKTPCLRCIIPEPQVIKAKFPVLGATPGVIACIQAMETVKLIVGLGKLMAGRMLLFDGETMEFDEIEIKRDPDCPVCGRLV